MLFSKNSVTEFHKLLTFGNILLESETESSALREIE